MVWATSEIITAARLNKPEIKDQDATPISDGLLKIIDAVLQAKNVGDTAFLGAALKELALGSYAGVNAPPADGLIVSGNVGIGTASPGKKLSVITPNDSIILATSTAELNDGASIEFGYNNIADGSKPIARIKSSVQSGGGGDLSFDTKNSDAAAWDTKVIILRNGNVGIGTAAPSELLSLGLAGTKAGELSLAGATSGKAIIDVPAAAGTPTLTLPTVTGTLEHTAGSQAKVDTHAALTASHGQATIEGIAGSQAKVDTHAALTNPHSSTALATADRLMLRDAAGRVAVVAPSASTDVALKSTVTDDVATHAALATGVHGVGALTVAGLDSANHIPLSYYKARAPDSAFLQVSHPGAVSTTSAAYEKLKTITINTNLKGTFRMYFQIKTGATATGYGKLYRNGIAIGSDRLATDTYVELTEDLTVTITSGDTIELWAKTSDAGVPTYVTALRLYYTIDLIPPYTTS